MDPAYLMLIDLNISRPELEVIIQREILTLKNIKSSVLKVISMLPSSTRVGLITFSSVVAVYELSLSGVAAATVLSGISSPELTDMHPILDRIDKCIQSKTFVVLTRHTSCP